MEQVKKAHPAIEVTDLKKTYRGGIEAVRGISFQVERGEIFGFLGPNGAGKFNDDHDVDYVNQTNRRPCHGKWSRYRQGILPCAYPVGYVSQDLAVDDNLTGAKI